MKPNYVAPIRRSLTVKVSQQTAFRVFTEGIGSWWPKPLAMKQAPLISMVLETRPAGRWYSIHEGGLQYQIGHVGLWEPSKKLILIWKLNTAFQYVEAIESEVEINFESTPDGTVVSIEHRGLDQLGEDLGPLAGMEQGWGMVLENFTSQATHCQANPR